MNSQGFSKIIVTFAVMILALWISFDVFASGGNALGKFYFYIMVGSGIFGVLSPRKAFYFLLFLTGYLDFFKRLMVLDAGVSQLDLYYVLGIAPATCVGIASSIIYQTITNRHGLSRGEGRLMLAIMGLVVAAFGLNAAVLGRSTRALGDTVNTVIYPMLVFIIPALFRERGDLMRLLKFTIILFVPSACYLIYQSFGGLTWWEDTYLRRGYSLESRQYGERIFRAFGTMNAAGNASVVYAIFAVVLLFGGFWKYRPNGDRKLYAAWVMRFLLAAIFIFAAWRTFSRTGWILAVIAAICFWAFRRRVIVISFYSAVLVIALAAIVSSSYLLKNRVLNEMGDALAEGRSDEFEMATRLSTLNDRLESWEQLKSNKYLWTPFGVRRAGYNENMVRQTIETHDAFTEALLTVGYIPVGIALITVAWLLSRLHRFVYNCPPGLTRELSVVGFGCSMGIAFGGTVNGAAFSTYPVNFYIYFFLGIVVSMMYRYQEEVDALVEAKKAQSMLQEMKGALPPGFARPPGRPNFA